MCRAVWVVGRGSGTLITLAHMMSPLGSVVVIWRVPSYGVAANSFRCLWWDRGSIDPVL